MKNFLFAAVIIFLSLIIFSCKKDNPVPPEGQPQLSLSLADTSCTEAWIKLTTTELSLPAEVALLRNGFLVENISLTTADTILFVDSLLPNHTYKFHTVIQPYDHTGELTSDSLTVKTMDTTSHNFTWQTWTFGGQAGSCTLYDIAIINENDIWAVGEIYLLDSTGVPDPNAYNAVHWDGNQWELKRIRTNACGGVDYPPIKAIFAFSSDNILFAHIDGSITHYNGIEFINDCSLITQLNGSANKIWGLSKNDYYVVSGNGFIAHYQNRQWSRIESGTTSIINDIWGLIDDRNKLILYCPVSSFFVSGDKKILKVIDNTVDSVEWNKDVRLYSTWTTNKNFLYVCGEGVFVNEFGNWKEINLPLISTNSIRGNNLNDIFVAGDFGFRAHFNGVTWKLFNFNNNIGFSNVTFKGEIVVICGYYNGQGLIQLGIRN